MRTTLIILLLLPLPALAHVGHLEEVDGHSHYIAAWALLGVIVGSLWLIWVETRAPRRKTKRSKGGGAGA
jgi:hypothetical protein